MKNRKTHLLALIMLLSMGMGTVTFAQKIPLVYNVENTGIKNPSPILPGINELPIVKPLTDPFQWSDGSGRSTNFKDWSRRRAEIAREIEHYEIGEKPVVSKKDITADIVDDTLRVDVTVNGQTLTLKAKITYPEGKGPFPAIIGIGRGTGSLPPVIFTSRNIVQIAFNFTQVMSHTQKRGNEPINKLYPDQTDMGAYCAWSWGVSRIIDGLEIVGKKSKIDTRKLAISGCSFAGKMALFAGAFDERIALTIAQNPVVAVLLHGEYPKRWVKWKHWEEPAMPGSWKACSNIRKTMFRSCRMTTMNCVLWWHRVHCWYLEIRTMYGSQTSRVMSPAVPPARFGKLSVLPTEWASLL